MEAARRAASSSLRDPHTDLRQCNTDCRSADAGVASVPSSRQSFLVRDKHMDLPRSVRVLIALAVLVLSLAALLLVLTISEATLNIQAHLDDAPVWLRQGWWGLLTIASLLVGWLLWRILRPRPRRPKPSAEQTRAAPSAEDIDSAMEAAEGLGADTSRIRHELAELQRRAAGDS